MNTSRKTSGRARLALAATVLFLSLVTLFMAASCKHEPEPEHSHTISEEWSFDNDYHWHAASCNIAEHNADRAAHMWDAGVVTTPATATADGEKKYTCTVCGFIRTESIPAAHEHVYPDDWSYRQVAGNVQKYKTCTLCTDEVSEDAAYTDIFTVSEGALSCKEDMAELLTGAWTIPLEVGESAVTALKQSAFIYGAGLTSVVIPESITSIGSYAFIGCSSMESLSIPASLATIGMDVFTRCASLSSFQVDSSNTAFSAEGGALYNKDKTTLIACPTASGAVSIKAGVTRLERAAFMQCPGITGLVFPDSLTYIGSYCFDGCTGLTTLVIPDSVTKLGTNAFANCQNLTEVTVGVNADRDGSYNIFYRTPAHIIFKSGRTTIPGGFLRGGNLLTEVTIPDTVTKICDSALFGCSSLTAITIPSSVTTIEANAFSGCTGLLSVTIPTSITSMGAYSFQDCTCEVVFAAGRTTIPGLALYGANAVTHVTVPAGVTTISNNAFYKCTSLEQITFGGTKAEWGAITKMSSWKTDVPTTCIVKCTDGDIEI